MATLHELPPRSTFGPFEVNTSAGELLRAGVRVRLPQQQFAILLLLLKNPGEVVTRKQFREHIWGEGTFVNFEQGLNVAMNKLRTALGDSADKPRYIETVPGYGYRFIGTLESRHCSPVSVAAVSETRGDLPRRRSVRLWLWLALAAACLVGFAVGLRLHYEPAAPPAWKLTQITNETGLSIDPAISSDGRLVAYSSDLAGEQDLYVRQTAGGQPIRLTFDGAGNTTPDFSPDGSRIVFRSNRNGGGVYEVPTFGGEVHLLARDGMNPKFSPDGSRIAYWVGVPSSSPTVPGTGAVWVVAASGGKPERIGPNFTSAWNPIWAPDGKNLLLIGYTSPRAFESEGLDWWLVSVNGGRAAKTGAHQAFLLAGLESKRIATPVPAVPDPGCWAVDGKAVIFSFLNGDTRNMWEIGLSPQAGKVVGTPRRLTTGSGDEVGPSCASDGSVWFTNVQIRRELWSLPFDPDHAKPPGPLERIAGRPARRETPSLSQDGSQIAFSSDQSGRPNIWIRDLETGKELSVASSSFAQRYPVSSPSGARVAFSVYEKDKRVVYEAAPGAEPVKLCEGCLRATDWSHDEKSLLVYVGSPYQIDLLDVASRKRTALLKHPVASLLYGRFSPGARWVSFTARFEPGRGRIVIAPIDGTKPVPETAWITIAETGADDYADWSPDGMTLYFTSGSDGHNCLWGQRIEVSSGRPVGEAFAVQHFHGRVSFGHGGWSVAGGRVALALVEATGNIWKMSPSRGR